MKLEPGTTTGLLGMVLTAIGFAPALMPFQTSCPAGMISNPGGHMDVFCLSNDPCDPSGSCDTRIRGGSPLSAGSYITCGCPTAFGDSGCCSAVAYYNPVTKKYDIPGVVGDCFPYYNCANGTCKLTGSGTAAFPWYGTCPD